MSKVLAVKDKKILTNAGFRIDSIIHKKRRERDLRFKIIKYTRSK